MGKTVWEQRVGQLGGLSVSLFTSLVGQMWSLKSNIPVWVTEYGTKQRTFHGRYWGPVSAHAQHIFGHKAPSGPEMFANYGQHVQCRCNERVHLGRRPDQSWGSQTDSWGIIRGVGRIQKSRILCIVGPCFPVIPSGSFILKIFGCGSQLATAVFLKDKTLVIVIANGLGL
eukprot:jgi/Botrbrau1/22811/Bobra.0132s0135.1